MKSIEKTENVVKDETKLFKRNWYIWAIIMAGLSSFFLVIIFWLTNIFQNIILSNLILQNGTRSYEFWSHPPVKLLQNFYIYNYTNVEDFESGKANKLRVQQLGPYSYRETLMRVNTQMHENGTISYQEKKLYKLEGGNPENDIIIVPNILLLMVISSVCYLNYASRLMVTIAISTMHIEPFIKTTVSGFLWGYDDNLYNVLKTFGYVNIPSDKFGILVQSHGLLEDHLLINTGAHDIDNLGIIQSINGKDILNIWGDEKCDKIYGTDGTMFPPKWIQNLSTPLYIYIKEFCKQMKFNFHDYNQVQGVPSLKYKMSLDSFQVSTQETCYCPIVNLDSNERKCPPSGTLNISSCYDDLPVLVSMPHFYGADESLINSVDGLKPEQELHESTIDLHQFLAIPMNGSLRLQLNVEVKKAIGVPFSDKIKDGSILPLMWSENTLDKLPQDFVNIFSGAHLATTIVTAALKWGSLSIFLCSICAYCFARRNQHIQRSNV
ncbi:PREDICTED: lysosome membrane protein 2-like [Polistes dominula]|uniref:Lysosome membrane protein 2-like n=1 Tax=Polistes dominula TaxID=743375 RepID=A0ABM1I511_POLDO|nr:PREDICTED: lysosome membrane protein 2-like [Polistes dominula]